MIFVDRYGHRRDYAFAEVSERSRRFAGAFEHGGVSRGDRVLVCLTNTAKHLFAALGLLRIGACVVAAEPDADAETLLLLARENGATSVVANPETRAAAEALRTEEPAMKRLFLMRQESAGWTRLDTLAESATPKSGAATKESDDACAVGGALRDQAWLRSTGDALARALGFQQSDVVWCSAIAGSAHWFTGAIAAPWSCGAATIAHEGAFCADERLDLIRELDATVVLQPLRECRSELALANPARFRLPRLRASYAFGDPNAEESARWRELFGGELRAYSEVSAPSA